MNGDVDASIALKPTRTGGLVIFSVKRLTWLDSGTARLRGNDHSK